MHKYRPVVFTAGGEDGVCGGRSFTARPASPNGVKLFYIYEEGADGFRISRGTAANLGEIRDNIEALVNGEAA